jgi:hypothetical protein
VFGCIPRATSCEDGAMQQIPEAVWNLPVTGRFGSASAPSQRTFGDEVGEQPTLLIFLRHLG